MRPVRFAGLAFVLAALALADAGRGFGGPGLDFAGIDRSISPTTDFYQFANGKWYDQTQIPPDRPSIGGFAELTDHNQEILREVAEAAAKTAPANPKSSKDKVGLFYRVGLDEERAERLGATPIEPEIKAIDSIKDKAGLVAELAALHKIGVRAGFGAGVSLDQKDSSHYVLGLRQGGLGLPTRQAYLGDDDRSDSMRTRYTQTVAKLLNLIGEAKDTSEADAAKVLALETKLAQASNTPVQLRDPEANYHKMPVSQFAADDPDFAWQAFFGDLGKSDPGLINVGQPAFFKAFDGVFRDEPLETWKAYLKAHLVMTEAAELSKPFVDAQFALQGGMRGMSEQQPRWKRVLGATNGALGMAIGQLWVQKAFPPEAKKEALALVQNLKAVLRERIGELEWMGPDTKKQAVAKLDAMRIKIGYPDKWRDYSKLVVKDDSYAQNAMRAREFEFNRMMARLGKPVDRAEMGMTPPTVNASYNPSMNDITFPAGILQPPFFDPKAPMAVNYGAIGAVIGHEMTHGFDDHGRLFDGQGNLRDWWTADDAKKFKERADALAAQYDAYVIAGDTHVNGKLTLGENIADLGGLKVAFLAYKKATAGTTQPTVEGFTPDQQFFLSFAQIWRQKGRPEAQRLAAATDPHSPPKYRVQGVLANTPEFWTAFGAQPPGGVITIW